MKHVILVAFIILCTGIEFGCKEDGTNTDNYQAIDSRLQLSIVESLGGARPLAVHAATERLYGCANYSLVATPSTTDSTFTISFDNVLEPSVCSPANSPAKVNVDLGALASGNYILSLRVNGTTVSAPLKVTDTSFSVTGGEGRWSTFIKTYTHKVPRTIIWGSMQSNDPNAATVFRSFNDSLVAAGAQVHAYASADYGFFQIDGSGAIAAPGSSFIFVKTYVYQYAGDMTVLRELVRRYGQSHSGQLDIFLYGGNGEAFQASVLAAGG